MLYLAHFSFREETTRPRNGYFTSMVEAKDVDEALNRFRKLIMRLRVENEGFDKPATIYLDDVIEIKKVPREGFVGHMVSHSGELRPSLSTSLPGVADTYCEAYGVGPETEKEEQGGVEIEPFITLD